MGGDLDVVPTAATSSVEVPNDNAHTTGKIDYITTVTGTSTDAIDTIDALATERAKGNIEGFPPPLDRGVSIQKFGV